MTWLYICHDIKDHIYHLMYLYASGKTIILPASKQDLLWFFSYLIWRAIGKAWLNLTHSESKVTL